MLSFHARKLNTPKKQIHFEGSSIFLMLNFPDIYGSPLLLYNRLNSTCILIGYDLLVDRCINDLNINSFHVFIA